LRDAGSTPARPRPRVAAIGLLTVWFGLWLLAFVSIGFVPEMALGGWRVDEPPLRLVARSQVGAVVALLVALVAVPRVRTRARLGWAPLLILPCVAAGLVAAQHRSFAAPRQMLRAEALHRCAMHGWPPTHLEAESPAWTERTSGQSPDAVPDPPSPPCLTATILARSGHQPPAHVEMMLCELGAADGCAKAAREARAIYRAAACRRLAHLNSTRVPPVAVPSVCASQRD
jgi:hypothetical protein